MPASLTGRVLQPRGQGSAACTTFSPGWPQSEGELGPGDVILATVSPTSSAMASRALWGLMLPLCPHPSTKPCRGHQSHQDMDCCCCAQGTASPGQFCISPPETSTFPLLTIPGKAWGLYYILLYFSFQKTVTGSFSTSATLPPKSMPFFFPPWGSHWCWESPLHGALAVADSAAHQDAPRVQSLPASSSKGLQGV